MTTVLALIDHPNLDVIIGPVLLKLKERGIQLKVYVTHAGKREFLNKHAIGFQSTIDLEKEFLSIPGPKLFLNAADQKFAAHQCGRKLDELCRQHSIPSLTIEHGTFFNKSEQLTESYQFDADKMAVIGRADYDKFIKLGVPHSKMVITGFPPFDEYYQFKKNNSFVYGNYIWIAGQNHTYVSGSGLYTKEEWTSVLNALYRTLLKTFPDFDLVIKPHPAEPYHDTVRLYSDAVGSEFSSRIKIVGPKFSNIEGISGSAFVVSFSRSVLFESVLLDKRAVGILLTKCSESFNEAKEFGAVFLEIDPSTIGADIPHRLQDMLQTEKDRIVDPMNVPTDYLEKYLYKFDGKASERVAEAITEMLRKKNQPSAVRPMFKSVGFERYMRLMGIGEEASTVDKPFTLLDIGSHDDIFRNFLPDATYFSYNGMVTEFRSTPFEDKSFDVVVASDVLEHVFCEDRKAFILELLRIARKKIVFSFPTESAEEFEKFALALVPGDRWLKEHIERGLPRKTEIDQILDQLGIPYDVKPNHGLASWICSFILDHTNIDANSKGRINEFLQKYCYEMEKHGPAYRYIYTVLLPFESDQKKNFHKKESMQANDFVPKVSIVIPVLNKIEYTCKCIEAIWRNTPAGMYEIIIVDNGSDEDTGLFLSTLTRSCVRIITNSKNLGFAKACNQGAAAAAAPYILFLNNDTEPQAGWIEPLMHVIESDQSVAAVGSKLIFPDGKIQHAGVLIFEDRKLPDPLVARHIYYNQDSEISDANIPRIYQALTAACVLLRKEAFDQVYGFDEGYWNGYEDIDLCFKLQEKKWMLVYEPKSVLIHYESKSGRERFTKIRENIGQLHRRWLGKIKPDAIIKKDGSLIWPETKTVRRYSRTLAKEKYSPEFSKRQNKTVSMVILTRNQLRYTKECFESIRKYTPEPHEIIFVDNGSTDNTLKWLKKIVKNNSNYKLIENSENLGFSKGCNQGIGASTGQYILLLNNDVVVTENWLAGMLECFNSAVDIGIVGPMTNCISGPQKVPSVDYSSVDDLSGYAQVFRLKNRHRRIPRSRVVGFCMLFKRSLIEEIGLLDESFGSGNYEDDDFCLRASLAGYRNVIAGDVFIHHYGSRSFAGNGIDYGSALACNRKIFNAKWTGIEVVHRFGKQLAALNAINKADELYRKGRLDSAVAALLEGIKETPSDKKLYFNLSEMLIDAKRYKDAVDLLESLQSGGPEKSLLLGACEVGLGNSEKAEQHADFALADQQSIARALNLKGELAYKRGDSATAETFFKTSMEKDPGLGETCTNMAVLKWDAGQTAEALDLFERGFILSPGAADVLTAYHSAITETVSFFRAERVFREAKALHPNDRRIAFILVAMLIRQGKQNLAMNEIEQAMMHFGIDDGILNAALEIRAKNGPLEISPGSPGPSLSVCMIVKNEEANLARCLMSVKPVVDEIIVVDTGSIDKTKIIASALGAKVFDFSWADDFSEARNYSLSKASGDWVLVLDADEMISPLDHAPLRTLIKQAKGRIAYSMTTRNYTHQVASQNWTANDGKYLQEEAGSGWLPSPKVRLFVNDKCIRFSNPVHELVEPAIRKNGIHIKSCGIPVHHYGRLNQNRVVAKGRVYYRLGEKKVLETNGDYQALRELAIQASEIGEYEEALPLWDNLLKQNPNDPVVYLNLGYAHIRLSRYDQGLIYSRKALELEPNSKEAGLNYAGCELIIGDVKNAIMVLDKLLQKNPDYPPALARLAAAYLIDGQRAESLKCLERLRLHRFDCAGILSEQARAFLSQSKFEKALVLLETAIETKNTNTDTHLLLAESHRKKEGHVISGVPGSAERESIPEQHV